MHCLRPPCPWPPSAPPTAQLGQVSCLVGPGPALAIFRSVFPSLKWVEVWVKLAPMCQWLLVTACALKVRVPSQAPSACGWIGLWARVLSQEQPCAVCVFVSWQKKVGPGREEGQTMEGVARGAAGGAEPRGVSELRLWWRGIPASDFLSQLFLGSCPAAPSPTRADGPAHTVCKSWGNSPLFPSKGIFL